MDSSWDKKAPGYEKSVTVSARDLATLLGFQQPVKEVGKPSYYASGYVKSITIDRITFSGRQFRDKLDLRSSCFTIQKQKQGYVITTKGFGHGLGMSQYGAQFMAQNKKTYQEILMHYYTGVKIEKK